MYQAPKKHSILPHECHPAHIHTIFVHYFTKYDTDTDLLHGGLYRLLERCERAQSCMHRREREDKGVQIRSEEKLLKGVG